MSEVNFSARISEERSKKACNHFSRHEITQKQFVENVIDNIAQVQKALDCVCANPRKTKTK